MVDPYRIMNPSQFQFSSQRQAELYLTMRGWEATTRAGIKLFIHSELPGYTREVHRLASHWYIRA